MVRQKRRARRLKGTRKGRERPKVSAYKGVSRFKNGRWYARISKNGVKKTLGIFQTEIEAARAYQLAALSCDELSEGEMHSSAATQKDEGESQQFVEEESTDDEDNILQLDPREQKCVDLTNNCSDTLEDDTTEGEDGDSTDIDKELVEGIMREIQNEKKVELSPSEKLEKLQSLGFSEFASKVALDQCRWNMQRAKKYLEEAGVVHGKKEQSTSSRGSAGSNRKRSRSKYNPSRRKRPKDRNYRSSKHVGVHGRNGKWVARMGVNGKEVHLGSFETEEEAARAYNMLAKSLKECNDLLAKSIKERNDLTDTKVSNQADSQEDTSSKVAEEHSVEGRANDDNCANFETSGILTDSGMVSIAAKGQKAKSSRLEDTKESWQMFLGYLGGEGTRERIENLMKKEALDVDVLGDCTDEDLKEIGMRLGDRKRIKNALEQWNENRPAE